MASTIEVRGSLIAGGNVCTTGCGSETTDRITKSLSLNCAGQYFETAVCTAQPLRIQTAGAPGAVFQDLELTNGLTAIEFLYLQSSSEMVLRIDAKNASLLGVAGTFPTLFAGGETLDLTVDGVNFLTTFLVGDQSAAQCAVRINAAAALAGLATPLATEDTSGQLLISGTVEGRSGSVVVVGGTGAATLGLSGSAAGAGEDVTFVGLFLIEFPRYPSAPEKVLISGNGELTVVAAGRSTTV